MNLRWIRQATLVFMLMSTVQAAPPPPRPKDQPVPLQEAIAAFNTRAQNDEVGRLQPPLTEEELVACIRGWVREQTPASDEVFNIYQRIAATGMLPPGAQLHFIKRWPYNGYEIEVWRVDLMVRLDRGVYSFRLRDQKIRSRPRGT